jgi:hypothetical protein
MELHLSTKYGIFSIRKSLITESNSFNVCHCDGSPNEQCTFVFKELLIDPMLVIDFSLVPTYASTNLRILGVRVKAEDLLSSSKLVPTLG